MDLEKKSSGDLLEISVKGVLDNDASMHFRDEIDACTRDGWHRIVINLKGVRYLSSAGIAALIAAKKQLDQLNGLFGIHDVTPHVATILRQVRMYDTLVCDPQIARAARSAGSMTMALSSSTRMASGDGVDMQIYPLDDPQPVTCRVIGGCETLFESSDTAVPSQEVVFDRGDLGIGIGTLGMELDVLDGRIGEIVSIEGAAAQSPHANGGLPDYAVAMGDFRPRVQMIYGVQCSGSLPTLVRFEPSGSGDKINLSTLIWQTMQQTNIEAASVAIIADCSGLVGAQLRRVPNPAQETATSHFQVPTIRRWLSFTSDRLYLRNLALIVGVVVVGDLADDSPLYSFVRKMHPRRDLYGHFHAAVFPYQPLKKRTLKLGPSVAELFNGGSIQDVLHLLHDDRPITGAGESELLSGACWIGAIERIEAAGEKS